VPQQVECNIEFFRSLLKLSKSGLPEVAVFRFLG
jgi:hypothetical protein